VYRADVSPSSASVCSSLLFIPTIDENPVSIIILLVQTIAFGRDGKMKSYLFLDALDINENKKNKNNMQFINFQLNNDSYQEKNE
jgi:hypothetical protein